MEHSRSGESDASSSEEPNAKKCKRDPNAQTHAKSVVVLLDSDVTVSKNNRNVLLMPNTIEMAKLKKPDKGQYGKIPFTSKMTQRDVLTALQFKFPILRNKRLGCASAADNRTRLDFHGDKRIWNGALINRHTRGNSALYVLAEENHESEESQVLLEEGGLAATQRLKQLHASHMSSSADQRHEEGESEMLQRGRVELTSQADHTTGGILQQDQSVVQKMQKDPVLKTIADPVPQASLNSMTSGRQQRVLIAQLSKQGSSLQQAPPAAPAAHNVPSTKKLSVIKRKRKSQPNAHREFPLLVPVSEGETTDSGIDSLLEIGSSRDTVQSRDIVCEISPEKGSTKGGDKFHILLQEIASFEVDYVACFQNCGTVHLEQTVNPFTLTGFTPKSLQGPGPVIVTLSSSDRSWWGGEAVFEYIDDPLTDEEYLSKVVTDEDMRRKLLDRMHKEMSSNKLSDGQTSDSFVKTGPGSSSLNQSKCAWSVKLLQLLVYKAAEIGGGKFIQMIFSTSAGKVVFNSYRNCAILPEDVARTNGHLTLANYLQDVDSRWSKESNSDAGTESIDWLELKNALDEEQSLTCTDEPQILKKCQPPGYPESHESDYFADDEISLCSSPCHNNVFESENEAQGQNSKVIESSCEQEVNEEVNLPLENNDSSELPLHLEGNQLEVIVSMKAESASYKHKQLDCDDVESHSSGDDITEKEHASTDPCYSEVEIWDPLESEVIFALEEDSAGTASLHTATHKCHNIVVTHCSESDLPGDQTELRMIDSDENSRSRAWRKPAEKSVCMLADHASQKNVGISTERLLKDLPFKEREPTIRDSVLGLTKLKRIVAYELGKCFSLSEDRKAETKNNVCNQETSDTVLRVTVLADMWRSPIGSCLNVHEQLVTQFAQHKQVQTTLLVPQFACTEEEKNTARKHNISIREAERRTGYNDPFDWLSFPPSDHAIDVVVGWGVKLGKQAQAIRESRGCKWVQFVHTAPEELGMYKGFSKAICKCEEKTRSEVDLCKSADAIVTVGPKMTEAYSSVLRSCGKHQDIIELTPGTLGEFSDVTQATMDGKKFNVLRFGHGDAEDFSLKGYDIAVKAIVALKDASYHLMFVGAPSGKEEDVAKHLLQSGISRCQLTIRTFLPSKERLKRLFCEVDLLIMPSRTEGFELTALKALSAGLPILVSGNSGVGYALRTLPSGKSFVVDSDEPNAWAKAIAGVRQKDRTERLKEIQRLRRCYEEKFSWERQCEALVERMQRIVDRVSHRIIAVYCLPKTELFKIVVCEDDLPIMSFRTEGFGLTALEALSAGLPILASGNSGVGYALRTLPSGKSVVVDSEEPNDCAKVLAGIFQKDRTERLQEIQRLPWCYAENFSWGEQYQYRALAEKMQRIVDDDPIKDISRRRVRFKAQVLCDPLRHFAETKNNASDQGTSDIPLRVTVLASEWNKPIGSYLTIQEQLVNQLAQHKQVQTSILISFACTEEEKITAKSQLLIREAEKPFTHQFKFVSFPPSDHAIDVVVGWGAKLGKQAHVIRESRGCKWVQFVHTAPEELGMYKDCSKAICKGEEKTRSEVDLCKLADAIVTVGPKMTEAYSSVLRSCGKHQDIIELTPGTLGEFSDVTQATMDGKKFNVLIFGRGDAEDFNFKEYDIAVKAIVALKDTSYRLMFVGAPNGNQEEVAKHLLQSGISRCQLTVRTFLPSKERLKRLFCEVDLLVMPSSKEGFELTALKALSAGLPILVSGNSGVGYALRTLPSGKSVVVDSDEPSDWAKAIAGVRQKDRTERLKEIQRLRRCYEEKFSWEKQCEALVEKMQGIVDERKIYGTKIWFKKIKL